MSGVVGVACNLARQQAARGWATELVGLAAPGAPSSSKVLSAGLRVTAVRPWGWLKAGRYDYRYFAPVAIRLSLAGRVDMHHAYSNPYHLALGRSIHRVLHYQTPISDVVPAYQRAMQRADAVICCSEFIRGQFLRQVGYPSDSIYVVPNGVDLERFRPAEQAVARARLGMPDDEVIILFVGQVNEAKGLLHLVKAFRALAPRSDAHLVVAGSSGLWGGADTLEGKTPYESQVAEAAEGLAVTFLGKTAQAEMPGIYQAADIFVCPSVWDEPFGMVALEAMACALPVVASQAGGLPEFIADGSTGFLVTPADVDALASRIEVLMSDRRIRERMGREGYRRAQRYGWGAILSQVHAVYESVMAV